MDMPGNDGYYGSSLASAVSSGSVPAATLNSMTSLVLTEIFAFGLFDKPTTGSPAQTVTSTTDQDDALQTAEEDSVLLKNSSNVLPLCSSDTSIAVLGADASSRQLGDCRGQLGVEVGGSDANLPLTGTLNVTPGLGASLAVSRLDAQEPTKYPAFHLPAPDTKVIIANDNVVGSDGPREAGSAPKPRPTSSKKEADMRFFLPRLRDIFPDICASGRGP
jgi:beta-glucosidase